MNWNQNRVSGYFWRRPQRVTKPPESDLCEEEQCDYTPIKVNLPNKRKPMREATMSKDKKPKRNVKKLGGLRKHSNPKNVDKSTMSLRSAKRVWAGKPKGRPSKELGAKLKVAKQVLAAHGIAVKKGSRALIRKSDIRQQGRPRKPKPLNRVKRPRGRPRTKPEATVSKNKNKGRPRKNPNPKTKTKTKTKTKVEAKKTKRKDDELEPRIRRQKKIRKNKKH